MEIETIVLDGLRTFRAMPSIFKSKNWKEMHKRKKKTGLNNSGLVRRRNQVIRRDGAFCKKCKATKKLSLDHIIPVSQGGSNNLDNLQILCLPCNFRKGITENPNYVSSRPQKETKEILTPLNYTNEEELENTMG